MAWAGVVGPIGFIAAWVIAGARTTGYSPVDDAISQLAASDAPTRWWMTAGFVCFGVAVPVFAIALRRELPGFAWLTAAFSGVATLGVAAFPLHVSSTVGLLHAIFADSGYVALALTPLLAGRALLLQGHRRLAIASMIVAAVSGACTGAIALGTAKGLFQRLGLTVVDVWLVGAVVAISKLRFPTPQVVVNQRKNAGGVAR